MGDLRSDMNPLGLFVCLHFVFLCFRRESRSNSKRGHLKAKTKENYTENEQLRC